MNNTLEVIEQRLIATSGGCLEYPSLGSHGYGVVSVDGKKKRVHRLMYELYRGEIPEGLVLDHLCRNRACANPDHLEVVTNGENLRRSPLMAFNNGNALKTHCKNGHEFTAKNTYMTPTGTRTCRTCNRLSAARTQKVRIARMTAPPPVPLTTGTP